MALYPILFIDMFSSTSMRKKILMRFFSAEFCKDHHEWNSAHVTCDIGKRNAFYRKERTIKLSSVRNIGGYTTRASCQLFCL